GVDLGHSDAVAEDRSSREGRRRIDGDDADAPAGPAVRLRQTLHERRLSRPRRSGDAEDAGAPRPREDAAEDLRNVAGAPLALRDRAADRARPALEHASNELFRAGARTDHAPPRICRAMTSF